MFLEDADFLLNFSLPAGWNVVIFFDDQTIVLSRTKMTFDNFQFLFNLYELGYPRAFRRSLKFARSSS